MDDLKMYTLNSIWLCAWQNISGGEKNIFKNVPDVMAGSLDGSEQAVGHQAQLPQLQYLPCPGVMAHLGHSQEDKVACNVY